jgi:hypothetical protein
MKEYERLCALRDYYDAGIDAIIGNRTFCDTHLDLLNGLVVGRVNTNILIKDYNQYHKDLGDGFEVGL